MRALLLGGSYSSTSRITSLQRCINLFPENTPPTTMPPTPVVHLLTPGLTLLAPSPAEEILAVTYVIDGAGATISTGVAGQLLIPFSGIITGVTLLADQSGSVVVDIWKSPYINYPPTISNSITGSDKPTISSGLDYQDTVLNGWTTTINANDVLMFNVNSVSNIQRLTIALATVSS